MIHDDSLVISIDEYRSSLNKCQGKSRKSRRKHIEHSQQKAFFDWVEYAKKQLPALANCYAVPNANLRTPFQGAWMKDEGLKTGVLDVNLDWPSQGFHGLRIEFKLPGRKLTPEQREWVNRYREAGYVVCIAIDWWFAQKAVLAYLNE